jgi:acylphosphatase
MSRRVVRIFVEGRVQGVGFRAFLVRQANALGLAGWARNRADGSVEALVAGPEAAIAALVDAARRGPLLSKVAAVHQEPAQESELAGATGFGVAESV